MSEPIALSWTLLQQLLDEGANPSKAESYRKRLVALLLTRSAAEVSRLHFELHALQVQARNRPLWCAASLFLGQVLDDHAFTQFRAWLIGHGQAVWLAVLADQNALCSLQVKLDRSGQRLATLPALLATPGKIYQQLVEGDNALNAQLRERHQTWCAELPDGGDDTHIGWAYWDLPEASELARCYPRLWALYSTGWPATVESPFPEIVRSVEVPGLGTVQLGDTLVSRGDGSAFTIEGLSAQYGMQIARVRDAVGGVRCNQGLSRSFQRWPHEAAEGPLAGDELTEVDEDAADPDEVDLDTWAALGEAIQARLAELIEGDIRVIYAAGPETDNGSPIDNLDEIAIKGLVRFVEIDPKDGERFESEVLDSPTWAQVAVIANRMMCQLRYDHHVYLEGIEIVRRPKGKPKVVEFVLGS